MSARLEPGTAVEVAIGVVRVVAPNPGMMTGPGTNTYLVGDGEVLVIDPGPAIDAHVDAICRAANGPVRGILVTHTHTDHSPAAAALAARTGAPLIGRPAPAGPHQDAAFEPAQVLSDGDSVAAGGSELTALHTPGHASNHLCFLRHDDGLLFTGDHVINGSTVVIDPPDGNMQQYLDSLARLKTVGAKRIAPGHGELFDDPHAVIDAIIAHRLAREQKVAAALASQAGATLAELTAVVYAEVPGHLHAVAERSLLAHLEKLAADGRARRDGERWCPA